jgi:hypothetical protein
MKVARGFQAVAGRAAGDQDGFHGVFPWWLDGSGVTISAMGRTFYNEESIICLQESCMSDPLAEVIALLRPRAVYSKVISGAGAWAVRYAAFGEPSFCAVLEGECVLAVDGQQPLTLARPATSC